MIEVNRIILCDYILDFLEQIFSSLYYRLFFDSHLTISINLPDLHIGMVSIPLCYFCAHITADSRGELRCTFIAWVLDERPSVRGPCMIFESLKKNKGHYSLAADVEGLVEGHNKRHICFLLSFCGPPAWKFRHIKLVAALWLCKLLTTFTVALYTWNLQCLTLSPTLKHTHRNFIIVAFTKILPTWIRL